MALVFDAHVDSLQRALDLGHDLGRRGPGHLDLVRAAEGGVFALVLVCWVDPLYVEQEPGPRGRARALLAEAHRLAARHPDKLRLVGNGAELARARADGLVAGVPGIEGGHAIEQDLGVLRELFDEGLRVMTLVWNNHLPWIRSCQDGAPAGTPAGLSPFGREVVREMNRLGVVVDLSHAGDRSFLDALEASERPVLASHSACRALHDHPRNLTDAQLRALAEQGGVVGVVFHPGFLDADARAEEARVRATDAYRALAGANETETMLLQSELLAREALPLSVERLVDHVVHAVEVAGIEHVGVGSDFDGIQRGPEGLGDASRYPLLAERLAARGFGQDDVARVLGGNVERVFAAATGPGTLAGGAGVTLDELFTPGWDHARDVLIVVGPGDPELYRALLEVGQARVVEYGTHEASAPPAPYVRATSPLDLFHAVLAFPGDPPATANLRRMPGTELGAEQVAAMTSAVRGAVESHAVSQRTTDRHAPIWARQTLENLPRLAELPSIAALRGAFAGEPCVIVSPGPSLAKNVHVLREVSGRAVVMTSSHALESLRRAGVTPDLVVVSDPLFLPRHFEGYDASGPQAFVFDVVVHPKHYALPARRIVTFTSHAATEEWIHGPLGERTLLDSGGSVACSELSLARVLGCDPIAFVGQDLALTDGRYYDPSCVDGGARVERAADGRSFELVRPVEHPETGELEWIRHAGEELIAVPANGGGEVATSATLYTFLQWFRVAAGARADTVFNCTEGGAHVDGMLHVPLARFAEALGEHVVDVGARLDGALAGTDVRARRERIRVETARMLAGAEACVRRARACRDLAAAVREGRAEPDELSRAEAGLADAVRPLPFVSMLAQERIRAVQAEAAEATGADESLRLAERLHATVVEAAQATVAPLREALARLA